ncbi:MAG: thioredoxin domain-containing protein [Patescibacteria group bacterium]|nr:thioredoxin domain-containing protein [Patescibacteria group bacterium]
MNKLNKKTIAIIVLGLIILIGALIAHFSVPAKTPETAQKFNVPERNDYFFGASTSPVTIVEFADFACPYCRNDYTVIREIGYRYKNSVKIIFKDFPLHDNSLDLAMAGRCAGEQGYFWPMHDKLFALQGQFPTSSLPDLAVSVGADKTKFTGCLTGKKYLNDIKADYADGQSLGVAGTPTFFINGYRVVGEIPADKFEQMIGQFLK